VPDVLSTGSWRLWYHAKTLLDALTRFGITPVHAAHEQIHASAATTSLISAAALIAVPRACAVLIIKAVAVAATAKGARLVLVGELITGKASKLRQ
jgi:tetrahydromethanopterin S-methyltransferase subunit D